MKNNYYNIGNTVGVPLIVTESLKQIQHDIDFINKNINYFCSNPQKLMQELTAIKETCEWEFKHKYNIPTY